MLGETYQLVLLTTSAGRFGFKHMLEPTSIVNRLSFWRWLPINEVPARSKNIYK